MRMKTELDDQSFQIEEDSDELEYPQELFSVGAFCTERKVSMVSFRRISPNRFLSSILLVVVIIVMVVIIVVILVVVTFAIVEVVIVVVVFGIVVVVVDGWACAFHQDKASSVKVPVANVTLFSLAHLLRENTDSVRSNQRLRSTAPSVPLKISLGLVFLLELLEVSMVAACAFRAEEMPSLISCRMASKVMTGVSDVDVLLGGILSTKDDTGYDKDGNSKANGGNDDEREINNVVEEEDGEWIRFLGGNSSSGIKKYRGLNSNDGGNIGNGVKIVDGAIGSGKNTDEIILYVEFLEELKDLFSDEARK
ncbi:hypothetical protein Tco_0906724 [Tanacetum coccineum]|uniref:Uncharacterized protein n=1 Tax=Tanacetum coccineum TaxID=301880 RepID=A0ABQ5CID4_9ASTR